MWRLKSLLDGVAKATPLQDTKRTAYGAEGVVSTRISG